VKFQVTVDPTFLVFGSSVPELVTILPLPSRDTEETVIIRVYGDFVLLVPFHAQNPPLVDIPQPLVQDVAKNGVVHP